MWFRYEHLYVRRMWTLPVISSVSRRKCNAKWTQWPILPVCPLSFLPYSLVSFASEEKRRNSNNVLELTWLKPIFTVTLRRANLSLCPRRFLSSSLLFGPVSSHFIICVPAFLLPFMETLISEIWEKITDGPQIVFMENYIPATFTFTTFINTMRETKFMKMSVWPLIHTKQIYLTNEDRTTLQSG